MGTPKNSRLLARVFRSAFSWRREFALEEHTGATANANELIKERRAVSSSVLPSGPRAGKPHSEAAWRRHPFADREPRLQPKHTPMEILHPIACKRCTGRG